jgi:hypothetical protein
MPPVQLGLAMVYGIVTQSGGAIDLATAPGSGTRFRIHFPEAHDAVDAAPATQKPHLGTTRAVVSTFRRSRHCRLGIRLSNVDR